jgi:hypothetical protein
MFTAKSVLFLINYYYYYYYWTRCLVNFIPVSSGPIHVGFYVDSCLTCIVYAK